MSCSSSWSRWRLGGPACTIRLCHDTNAAGGIGAQRGRGQFLRAHRSKLQFDGRDAVIDVPKLDFRELTEQYPDFPGTSLATMFRSRGYRTTFVTPSDMEWASWRGFLEGHGFEDVLDYRDLACPAMLSSWGVEDRCMVDKVVDLIAVPARALFRDRVDDANAPSVRAQSWSSPAQSAAGADPGRLGAGPC